VDCAGDHRIALLALASAVLAGGESEITGFSCVDTSYPDAATDAKRVLTGAELSRR
jgi:5-enolpyruvylshikimate-3-phosphate synthase